MMRNLDKHSSGSIDWRQFMSYLVLLNSKISDETQSEKFFNECKAFQSSDNMIKLEDLKRVSAWFDQSEISEDRDYSHPFPRVELIKELLFKINAEEGCDEIAIKPLVVLLRAKELTIVDYSLKTYKDLLFKPIKR